jgi:formamidopyrimidine-DNA glycosylase
VPEGLEAEIWRGACEQLVGRTIVNVVVDERVVTVGFAATVTGATIESARRLGKVVVLETDAASIGLHFGMTGRLVVDGAAPIDRLAYSSARDDPAWDRLVIETVPRGRTAAPALRFNDPRRLGHVSLDPDLGHLGVDFTRVTPTRLAAAFAGRRGVLKSTLLDQQVMAGLGNLCADEVLWWSGLDPRRRLDSLSMPEIARLASAIRRRLPVMARRGGSTHGTLDPMVRAHRPPCPRDATPLARATIGGRTTVWCPGHQR